MNVLKLGKVQTKRGGERAEIRKSTNKASARAEIRESTSKSMYNV